VAKRWALRAPDIMGAGHRTLDRVGRASLMAAAIVRALPRPRTYGTATLSQAYAQGVRSLPLVIVMAALGGAVIARQAATQFTGTIPLWVVGQLSAASVITELGPVLTALVLIGRLGASIAAELATMKVTEQIDALYAVGRDPVSFLVVPRVLGSLLVVPALVIIANGVGLLTSLVVGVLSIDGLTVADFVYGMRFYFRPWALWYSVIKAAIFGVTITFLACFIGLDGRGGAEGVGRTTTAAVVASTLAIMIWDVTLVPLLAAF